MAAAMAVLESQPSFNATWISVANIYGRMGDFESAKDAARKSLAINPFLTMSLAAERLRVIAMSDEAAEPLISGLRAAGLLDDEWMNE